MEILGLFAKFWEPGQVKTRLAAGIGDVAAGKLYRAFLDTLLARLNNACQERALYFWPPEKQAEFAAIADGWKVVPQASGDLGQRMRRFFEESFNHGCQRAVLLGSDSPNVPREHVRLAFSALIDHDVVLGPTHDGGYYLIGARGRSPKIFDNVAWSSPDVWQQTMDNVRERGLRCAELPPWYDVDDLEDLQQLRHDLASADEPALVALHEFVERQLPSQTRDAEA